MEISATAPDFEISNNLLFSDLISQNNGVIVIFFFESKNLICQTVIKTYRNLYNKFKEIGWDIVGVSTDSQENLDKIAEKLSLKYNLVSDYNGSISKNFGVLGKGKTNNYFISKSLRRTILIDQNMKVMGYYQEIIPIKHADEVLDFIKSYQSTNIDEDFKIMQNNTNLSEQE